MQNQILKDTLNLLQSLAIKPKQHITFPSPTVLQSKLMSLKRATN